MKIAFKEMLLPQRMRLILFALMILCVPLFLVVRGMPGIVFAALFTGLLVLWGFSFYFEKEYALEDLPLLILITATFTFGRAFSVLPIVSLGVVPIPITEIVLALTFGLMLFKFRSVYRDMWVRLPRDLQVVLPGFIVLGTLYMALGYKAHGALALRDIVFCHYMLFLFITLRVFNHPAKLRGILKLFIPPVVVLLLIRFVQDFITRSGQVSYNQFLFDMRQFNWAFYLGLLAIFGLTFFYSTKSKWRRWGYGFMVYWGIIFLIFTEVRAGWVGVVLGLILLGILLRKEMKILLFLVPLLVVSVWFIDSYIKKNTMKMIKKEVAGFTTGKRDTLPKKNIVFRYMLWKQSWKKIKEKPIFGWGFGSFPQYYIYKTPLPSPKGVGPGSKITPAHNHLVAITYKMGFLGLLLFIYFNLRIFLMGVLYYFKCQNPYRRRLLAACLAALVHWHGMALFFDVLESPPTGIFLWIILGMILCIIHTDKQLQTQRT